MPLPPSDAISSDASRLSVVVVEDEAGLRRVLEQALWRAGFAVTSVPTCEVAMHYLEHDPDVRLVLTDIKTPGAIDGYELAHHVRERYPEIAVLVMSGKVDPRPGDLPFGAWFIAKPFGIDALVGAMNEAIRVRTVAASSRPQHGPSGPRSVP